MERLDKHCPKRQNSAAAKHRKRDTDFEYEQISTAAKRKKCDISDDNSRSSNYVASQSEGESGKNSAAAKHRKRDTDFEYEQISTAAKCKKCDISDDNSRSSNYMLRHNQRVNRGKMANADQFRMRVLRIYPIMTVPWILTNVTESSSSWFLSEGQSNFVETYVCDKYVGDTALKETVLKDQPKPNHKGLQALKLDPDMVDLLPRQAQHPARSIDTSFRRIQGRMLDTMGPLGKLWGKLEDRPGGLSLSVMLKS